ncbi:MAG: DMT family transporter [Brachymonas sp.]|nr:DMT family transporter [Brachymonas sp.]
MSTGATSGNNLRSIVFMLLAVAFFCGMDATLKVLSSRYPPVQIAAMRGATGLPLLLIYITARKRWAGIWRIRWPLHLLRGVLGIAMLAAFSRGLRDLPLSSAYTLFFIGPMLITLLSVPILKERVPASHWWAVAAGFMGVLVAFRPNGVELGRNLTDMAGLAILFSALCYAISALYGRLASKTDSSESIMLTLLLFMAGVGGMLAWPQWVPLRTEDALQFAILGITGFTGQLALTEAFRHGQASAVAPFEYAALAGGLALDWLIWRTLPALHTLLGAAIIIVSGLVLLRREQRLQVKTQQPLTHTATQTLQ